MNTELEEREERLNRMFDEAESRHADVESLHARFDAIRAEDAEMDDRTEMKLKRIRTLFRKRRHRHVHKQEEPWTDQCDLCGYDLRHTVHMEVGAER
jgi:tRNA 2-selenouridine synthase SelU